MVPGPELTDDRKFATHVGEGDLLDPNIVESIPTDLLSNLGGSAVVGVGLARALTLLREVIFH